MEQAIYYTLSTIAQTLAGALAVLVAFILFGLGRLDGAVTTGQANIQARATDWMPLWFALLDDPDALHARMRPQSNWDSPQLWDALYSAHAAVYRRPRLSRVFSWALICSVVDIGLCFLALPFASRLACSKWAASLSLGAIVCIGIVCLALYTRLIFVVVEPPKQPPDPPKKSK